jgi:hypothetical protein
MLSGTLALFSILAHALVDHRDGHLQSLGLRLQKLGVWL